MNNKLCKWLGHKWQPLFLEFTSSDSIRKQKAIISYCLRCRLGADEVTNFPLHDINITMSTYNEELWKKQT